jgi:hypothetical protein
MKKLGARIKHPKQRGEWAELCFREWAADRTIADWNGGIE